MYRLILTNKDTYDVHWVRIPLETSVGIMEGTTVQLDHQGHQYQYLSSVSQGGDVWAMDMADGEVLIIQFEQRKFGREYGNPGDCGCHGK